MPRVTGNYQGEGIQAVLLALGILEFLSQNRSNAGVTELARHFDTSKSRIHRHLQTLMSGGYVIQDEESDRYRVSARLMALGETVGQNFDLASIARPVMEDLRAGLGHGVAVSVPEPDGMRIIAVVRGGSNAEIGVKRGSLMQYHASAQGKLSLAFGSANGAREVLTGPMDAVTPYSITDPDVLREEIGKVKDRGWATAGNQAMVGLNALAAPIFDAIGHFAGAISIVDATQFVPDMPSSKQIEQVVAASKRISGELGARLAS